MWTLEKLLKRPDVMLVVGRKTLTCDEMGCFMITPTDTNWDNQEEADEALEDAFYTNNITQALNNLFAEQ